METLASLIQTYEYPNGEAFDWSVIGCSDDVVMESSEKQKKKRRRRHRKRRCNIREAAASPASVCSFDTESSGIGSADSLSLHDLKSSISSAASSIGFDETLHSPDIDEEEFLAMHLSEEAYLATLEDPELIQYFNEQKQFFRAIYEQQFAALSAIHNNTSHAMGHLHQHLGLPPQLPRMDETVDQEASIGSEEKTFFQRVRMNAQQNMQITPSSEASECAESAAFIRNYSLPLILQEPSMPPRFFDQDKMSSSIFNFYLGSTQQENTLAKKLHLRDILYHPLSQLFPVCGLYVVGSSLNGFGTENSDMDLCLVVTEKEINQSTEAINILHLVQTTLGSLGFLKEQVLIRAKVPILRLRFNGAYDNMVVDINANNAVAIRNTHLLSYYAFYDWRVRPLVAVVKEWAKKCDINDASRSSFTSYSLVLMVLHYLQVIKKPVLPSLQSLYPKIFHPRNDVRFLNITASLDDSLSREAFKCENQDSLRELLAGFFDYFANVYDYETSAISVRLGCKVSRKDVNTRQSSWSPICIEEPFTLMNTAHSIYDERVFTNIKLKFREAYDILQDATDITTLLDHTTVRVSPSVSNNLLS